MEDTVGFGIIGCGAIGGAHAASIVNACGSRLVAVADVSEKRAESLGDQYRVPFYTDYRHLLDREDIDVVNICLPSGLHMDACVDAAGAGKHILCEKPLEVTLEKTDAIIEAVKENCVKLGVVFQRRFTHDALLIRKAISSGKLGRLISGSAYLKYYRDQAYYGSGSWRGTWKLDGGGCLMNQGIHGIDLLQWYMGPVTSVYALTDTVAHENIEVEDIAVAILKFANGAIGIIEGSTSYYPGLPTRLEICGTNGTVALREEEVVGWDFINPTREDIVLSKAGAKRLGVLEDVDRADPMTAVGDSHIPVIEDMVRAILDKRDPAVTGEEARKAVEIILAIYASSELGQEVELPLGSCQ
ncbi:MAG TPA: Gfo/Idh/MocA family oxidoreductase [Bacillota bacterium]|nr:Gfo/Idh/MocA family oxidoreductase [Bacillota bacterium]